MDPDTVYIAVMASWAKPEVQIPPERDGPTLSRLSRSRSKVSDQACPESQR
jgi:hypothetical protein